MFKNIQLRGAGRAGEETYKAYDDEHAGESADSRLGRVPATK